jgi:hypothetical protein
MNSFHKNRLIDSAISGEYMLRSLILTIHYSGLICQVQRFEIQFSEVFLDLCET